jgi:hypothetical protein
MLIQIFIQHSARERGDEPENKVEFACLAAILSRIFVIIKNVTAFGVRQALLQTVKNKGLVSNRQKRKERQEAREAHSSGPVLRSPSFSTTMELSLISKEIKRNLRTLIFL